MPYGRKDYGKFYSGDSYVVLNVSHLFLDVRCCADLNIEMFYSLFLQTRLVNNKLKWDIHFWLGKDTTQVRLF